MKLRNLLILLVLIAAINRWLSYDTDAQQLA